MKQSAHRAAERAGVANGRLDKDLTEPEVSGDYSPIKPMIGGRLLPNAFEVETRRAVARLQECLGSALGCLGGASQRPADVARALGLDPTLAWKISRLAREADALAAVSFIPGHVAMKRVILAMEVAGVPDNITAATDEAFQQFLGVGKRHAPTRAALDMMASAASPNAQRSAEVEHRKQSFLGNAYTWGVQAEVQVRSEIVHPSPGSDRLDAASVRGFHQLQRIRPNVTWPITRLKYGTDHDETIWRQEVEFLDDASGGSADGVPLLQQFCSKPLPSVRRVLERDGFSQYLLDPGPVGKTGALEVMTGIFIPKAFNAYAMKDWETSSYGTAIHTPCHHLQFDVFVFDGIYVNQMPEMNVISELTSAFPVPNISVNHTELPISAEVQHLGRGLAVARSPVMPGYIPMMRYVMDRQGWDESRFDVYRVAIEYPPIPAVVVLKWQVPEKP